MNILPATESLTVRQEGTRVVVARRGGVFVDLPWQAALEVARALYAQAKKAEELAAVETLIADQAIIQRVGFPIGLTAHPKIQAEAFKEAQWGDVRRYIPSSSIASGEAVGTPTVIRHRPKKGA